MHSTDQRRLTPAFAGRTLLLGLVFSALSFFPVLAQEKDGSMERKEVELTEEQIRSALDLGIEALLGKEQLDLAGVLRTLQQRGLGEAAPELGEMECLGALAKAVHLLKAGGRIEAAKVLHLLAQRGKKLLLLGAVDRGIDSLRGSGNEDAAGALEAFRQGEKIDPERLLPAFGEAASVLKASGDEVTSKILWALLMEWKKKAWGKKNSGGKK